MLLFGVFATGLVTEVMLGLCGPSMSNHPSIKPLLKLKTSDALASTMVEEATSCFSVPGLWLALDSLTMRILTYYKNIIYPLYHTHKDK